MPWKRGKEAETGESSVTQGATGGRRFGGVAKSIRYGTSKRSATPSEDGDFACESASDNCPQLELPFVPKTKRKPLRTLNSLISKFNAPEDTKASSTFELVQAGYQDGDKTEAGSNGKCIVGILPPPYVTATVKLCPLTLQSFEEDIEAKGWGKKRLDEQLSVVAKLMNTMFPKIETEGDFGFRKNGITTEVRNLPGRRTHNPWIAVMTATEDMPECTRGGQHHFPCGEFDRISRDYYHQVHCPFMRIMDGKMYPDPGSASQEGERTPSLSDDMPLVEDNVKDLNSSNKLVVINAEFKSPWFSPSRKDEYVLDFRHTANQPEVYTSRLSSVDNRETTPEDEERFNRNLEPLIRPLSIMLNEGVSDIQYHLETKDGYSVKVEEMNDGSSYWKATLVDQKSGDSPESGGKTFRS